MQYTDENGEIIQPERWSWLAVYNDNTVFHQFDSATGLYHYFREIDHSKVLRFGLKSMVNEKHFVFDVPKDAKLIHFYDNFIQQSMAGGNSLHHRLYCVGYELGKDKKIYTMLPTDVYIVGSVEDIGVL